MAPNDPVPSRRASAAPVAAALAQLPEAEKIGLTESGLAYETFAAFAAELDMSPSQLLQAIDIPDRTIYRRTPGAPLSNRETERVLRVADQLQAAIDAIGSAAQAVRWIREGDRIRRAAFAFENASLDRELAQFVPTDNLVERMPIPQLPPGFSARWELDDIPALPGALAVRCIVSAHLGGESLATIFSVSPSIKADDPALRHLVYPRFVEAVEQLREKAFRVD